MVDLPRFVPTLHHDSYPAIDPIQTDLSTKTVVITGGASGVGKATCFALCKARVKHLIILDRSQNQLLELTASLEREFGIATSIHAFVANITDAPLIGQIFDAIHRDIGEADVLVNNAAYQPFLATFQDTSLDDWKLAFDVNAKGSFIVVTAFLRHAKKNATVINVSSILAHWGNAEGHLIKQSSYSASKIAMTRAMEILQKENPELRVISLHPGLIVTPMSIKAGAKGVSIDSGKASHYPFANSRMIDASIANLPAHFIVWATNPEADFLKGRMVWANWDVEELKAKANEIIESDLLTLGLHGVR